MNCRKNYSVFLIRRNSGGRESNNTTETSVRETKTVDPSLTLCRKVCFFYVKVLHWRVANESSEMLSVNRLHSKCCWIVPSLGSSEFVWHRNGVYTFFFFFFKQISELTRVQIFELSIFKLHLHTCNHNPTHNLLTPELNLTSVRLCNMVRDISPKCHWILITIELILSYHSLWQIMKVEQ